MSRLENSDREACQASNGGRHLPPRQAGFTLLEMVLVITLLSILSVSIAPIISNGFSAARISTAQMDTLTKLHYALIRISREIRQVSHNGTNYQITTAKPSQLVFIKNDGDNIEIDIRKSGSRLKLKYVNAIRNFNIDSDLSNDLNSLAFRYLDIDNVVTTDTQQMAYVEVSISLTIAGSTDTITHRSRIALRDRV
ncbi:MAG: type II secretion system protein J [Thiohalomonadales bacterium]